MSWWKRPKMWILAGTIAVATAAAALGAPAVVVGAIRAIGAVVAAEADAPQSADAGS